jgi:hypothetical protein
MKTKNEKYHYPTYKEIVAEHIRSWGVMPTFEEKMRYQNIRVIAEKPSTISRDKGVL